MIRGFNRNNKMLLRKYVLFSRLGLITVHIPGSIRRYRLTLSPPQPAWRAADHTGQRARKCPDLAGLYLDRHRSDMGNKAAMHAGGEAAPMGRSMARRPGTSLLEGTIGLARWPGTMRLSWQCCCLRGVQARVDAQHRVQLGDG